MIFYSEQKFIPISWTVKYNTKNDEENVVNFDGIVPEKELTDQKRKFFTHFLEALFYRVVPEYLHGLDFIMSKVLCFLVHFYLKNKSFFEKKQSEKNANLFQQKLTNFKSVNLKLTKQIEDSQGFNVNDLIGLTLKNLHKTINEMFSLNQCCFYIYHYSIGAEVMCSNVDYLFASLKNGVNLSSFFNNKFLFKNERKESVVLTYKSKKIIFNGINLESNPFIYVKMDALDQCSIWILSKFFAFTENIQIPNSKRMKYTLIDLFEVNGGRICSLSCPDFIYNSFFEMNQGKVMTFQGKKTFFVKIKEFEKDINNNQQTWMNMGFLVGKNMKSINDFINQITINVNKKDLQERIFEIVINTLSR
jgi:hypothetical protein